MQSSLSTLAILLVSQGLAPAGELGLGDDPVPLAPDGSRGFGVESEPDEIAALMGSEDPADREFVGSLLESASMVQILAACTWVRYREQGYWTLLSDELTSPPPSLSDPALGQQFEALAQRFGQLVLAPHESLTPVQALAFARMVGDERFRVRANILKDVEGDLRLLPGTLRLFAAHAFGRAEFESGPVLATLCANANLAAARLRAIRLDLEALHQSLMDPATADSAQVLELAQALVSGDRSKVESRLLDLDSKAQRAAGRLGQGLFTPRFNLTHVALLAERKAAQEQGQRSFREMGLLVPFSLVGATGGSVGGIRATDRYRLAVNSGIEGLAADPAHAGLNFSLAVSLDFTAGRGVSSRYFDRFLALQGILHWEQRCFTGRELTAREAYAAWVLTGWRREEPDD